MRGVCAKGVQLFGRCLHPHPPTLLRSPPEANGLHQPPRTFTSPLPLLPQSHPRCVSAAHTSALQPGRSWLSAALRFPDPHVCLAARQKLVDYCKRAKHTMLFDFPTKGILQVGRNRLIHSIIKALLFRLSLGLQRAMLFDLPTKRKPGLVA